MKCAHLHRPIKVTNPSISQTPARTPPGNKQLGFNRTEEEENQDVADQIWSSTSLCQSDSLWWWTVTAPVCPDRGCVSDSLTSDRQCPLKSNHLGTGQPDIINQPTWRTIWTFTSQKAQKKHWCNVKEIWITCLYNVSSEISTVKQEFFFIKFCVKVSSRLKLTTLQVQHTLLFIHGIFGQIHVAGHSWCNSGKRLDQG